MTVSRGYPTKVAHNAAVKDDKTTLVVLFGDAKTASEVVGSSLSCSARCIERLCGLDDSKPHIFALVNFPLPTGTSGFPSPRVYPRCHEQTTLSCRAAGAVIADE